MQFVHNPYDNDATLWLRGNLHAHTTNSDGDRSPQDVVDAYAAMGYDFLMISDHDYLTRVDRLNPRGMVLLPGVEVTAQGPHMLYVNAGQTVDPHPDRQQVLDKVRDNHGFVIMNHPNWGREFNHCPQELLERVTGYTGIEIYNGVVRWQEGSPVATDRWDRLLSTGRSVWGYANDDTHWPVTDGQAWNVAKCHSRDRESIVKALREGSFYASTGVVITAIEVTDTTIRVETANAHRITVLADFGRREHVADGPVVEYDLANAGAITYIRIECWGAGEAMAWTQPLFVR